ncbi:MAG: putative MarR family transcriptional regulator, partial [Dehalococcoidia bacterium]|nr:putative MarR family transcriptional regulator [Dehalococcoidia bacterium]
AACKSKALKDTDRRAPSQSYRLAELDRYFVFRYSLSVQQLDVESIEAVSPAECSVQLLEVAPLIMRRIRSEMRRGAISDGSVPSFRTLRFLRDQPGASISEVAEFLGLTLPSASKIIQKMVTQGAIERQVGQDRRFVCLSLTEEGRLALALARLETAHRLEESLQPLCQEDLATVSAALRILGKAFSKGGDHVDLS